MRSNPLLMTVMSGNPCHANPGYQENPFILIDSATNKIIRTWRGSMMDRKPWDWATDAARRLGRPVFVVAHPYVPKTFRAGVEVSPLFYAGGSFQEVRPDGSTGPAPAYGYKKNPPGFFPSMAGGIAGSLIANALANPRRIRRMSHPAQTTPSGEFDAPRWRLTQFLRVKFRGLIDTDSEEGRFDMEAAIYWFAANYHGGQGSEYYQILSTSSFRPGPMARGPEEGDQKTMYDALVRMYGQQSNPAASAAWNKMSSRQRRYALFIGAGIEDDQVEAYTSSPWSELPQWVKRSITLRWQKNSASRRAQRFMSSEVSHLVREKGYPQKRAVAAAYSIAREKGYKLNPGSRRKVTMSLEAFAKYIKSKNDPKLWNDFIKKVKGYQKWTHGTLPKRVTIEVVDKPGVSGLWMTYDAGTVPESAYVMPKGSKRKGAWKHPWETGHPRIKHDPEAGIVMHKLTGQNRISDFYHK